MVRDFILRLFHFMNIVKHATGDADDEGFEVAPGTMPGAARDIDGDAFVQFDFRVIQRHPPLAAKDVVKLIRALVVMHPRIRDLQMVHLPSSLMALLNKRADLPAGLQPRLHIGEFATDVGSGHLGGLAHARKNAGIHAAGQSKCARGRARDNFEKKVSGLHLSGHFRLK